MRKTERLDESDESAESDASAGSDAGTSGGSAVSGIVREPAPVVDGTTLPSLTDPGVEVEFRAQPGGTEVVYFGSPTAPTCDDRRHNVGPWFVGANETLNQEFTSAGDFEGVCTVHPSGQLILVVGAA